MDSLLLANIIDLAITIQQIPSPTYSEAERAAFIHGRFMEAGLRNVEIDEIGNVYGRLPGAGTAAPLVVSAHSDTVFPVFTDLKVSRDGDMIFGPGIGDNALGIASLFGLMWYLRKRASSQVPGIPQDCTYLPGDIWLVANVGEEGLGDLRGMQTVVDRFGDQPLAYLIIEGLALGQVYHRGLGVHRKRITARTSGGHSWVDFGSPSAIHELSGLITRLLALSLPDEPRTTLNVGVIQGGTSVNTIASEAHIELDLRSVSAQTLSDLIERVEDLVEASHRAEAQFSHEIIGDRPIGEISSEHPLIRLVLRSLEALGVRGFLNIGSTDANIPLSRGFPAVCVGLTTGGGAHTVNEYINASALEQGMTQLIAVVEGVFREL